MGERLRDFQLDAGSALKGLPRQLETGEIEDLYAFTSMVAPFWPYGDQGHLVEILQENNCALPGAGEGAFSIYCAGRQCLESFDLEGQNPRPVGLSWEVRYSDERPERTLAVWITDLKMFVYHLQVNWPEASFNADMIGNLILGNNGRFPTSTLADFPALCVVYDTITALDEESAKILPPLSKTFNGKTVYKPGMFVWRLVPFWRGSPTELAKAIRVTDITKQGKIPAKGRGCRSIEASIRRHNRSQNKQPTTLGQRRRHNQSLYDCPRYKRK
ncbi:MAG: hypothetical protein JW991_00680 [Candidatus Pacebacteria bacterium]|nr:hypothetical protein [Candidatus Paceibacterota bacterium]